MDRRNTHDSKSSITFEIIICNMIWLIIKKELLQEIRSKESVLSMVVFGIAVIMLIAFSIDLTQSNMIQIMPGIFWLTYLFSAVIGLLRSFGSEKEMNAFGMLLSSPIDRGNIYIGKMIAVWVFIGITQLVTIPLFTIIFGFSIQGNLIAFIGFIMLTDWALAAVGTSVSGIGMRTRMGEVLVPMLLYPMLSPVLISAVKVTGELMRGGEYINYSFWIMIIFTFSVVFSIAGYLTFDTISEE